MLDDSVPDVFHTPDTSTTRAGDVKIACWALGNAGGPMSRSPRVFQDVGALESVRKDLPVGTRQLSFERYENDLVTTLGKWGSIPRSVENYERAITVS